jgi:HEAT repeat protein
MMKFSICIPRVLLLMIACLAPAVTAAIASEPQNPDTGRIFDKKTEDKINKTSSLGSEEAFERLKEVDFIVAEDRLSKAIHKSFSHRKNEGIEISLAKLSLPERAFSGGTVIHRANDLYIGKKIFEAFQEESIPRLLKLYERGDPTTRGNVVRVSGNLAGTAVTDLLIKALADKTFCEQEDPEADGPPLRICDLAYNQLVLRYRIQNVLRTIGPPHRLENRDYHISVLRGRL